MITAPAERSESRASCLRSETKVIDSAVASERGSAFEICCSPSPCKVPPMISANSATVWLTRILPSLKGLSCCVGKRAHQVVRSPPVDPVSTDPRLAVKTLQGNFSLFRGGSTDLDAGESCLLWGESPDRPTLSGLAAATRQSFSRVPDTGLGRQEIDPGSTAAPRPALYDSIECLLVSLPALPGTSGHCTIRRQRSGLR